MVDIVGKKYNHRTLKYQWPQAHKVTFHEKVQIDLPKLQANTAENKLHPWARILSKNDKYQGREVIVVWKLSGIKVFPLSKCFVQFYMINIKTWQQQIKPKKEKQKTSGLKVIDQLVTYATKVLHL